ncbi:hypothetical protein PGB90_004290 [Kerria lacca]
MNLKSTTNDYSGSDNIRPTDDWFTSVRNGCVKIRGSEGIENPPICVPTLLKQASELFSNHVFLIFQQNDKWKKVTYSQLLENVTVIAKAFLKLGLERFHGVSIIGENSEKWIYAHLAAIMAGGVSSGIYTTNSPDACLHCIKIASSDIVILENDYQLQKILKIKDQCPHIKVIVQLDGEPTDRSVLNWNNLLEIGRNEPNDKLKKVIDNLAVNEVCTLSGTTALPKAVMLNHDNLIFDGRLMASSIQMEYGIERTLSYLPYSHIAGLIYDIYTSLVMGSCVYIAGKNALKGDAIINNLKIAKPTTFIGTPRIFEKISEYLRGIELTRPVYLQYVLEKAKSTALAHHTLVSKEPRVNSSFKYKFFEFFFYSYMKSFVGLHQCKTLHSAAAPLSPQVRDYLASFDISVGEMYGLSETSGEHLYWIRYYSGCYTGVECPRAVKTKIYNPDKNGEGEICAWGRNIFMGYLNEPDKTKETTDEEGWFYTSDIGKINDERWIQITGRKKEIIITSGGENIPAVLIENVVKYELPILSQAVLVGEGKKYLTILLTLKCEYNEDTDMPLDKLSLETENWCKSLGCSYTTISEIIINKPHAVYDEIQKGIDRVNSKAISTAQRIQKFTILPRNFSTVTGELGPSTKLMRYVVYNKFKDYIESMY